MTQPMPIIENIAFEVEPKASHLSEKLPVLIGWSQLPLTASPALLLRLGLREDHGVVLSAQHGFDPRQAMPSICSVAPGKT